MKSVKSRTEIGQVRKWESEIGRTAIFPLSHSLTFPLSMLNAK